MPSTGPLHAAIEVASCATEPIVMDFNKFLDTTIAELERTLRSRSARASLPIYPDRKGG